MAIAASFKQFKKSNGGACQSPLDYRPPSHTQALKIDRLKQVRVESKGLAEIGRIASFGGIHSDQDVPDCLPVRALEAATEPGSFNQTKRIMSCALQHP